MTRPSRESEFLHRPTVLKRGIVSPLPKPTTYGQRSERQSPPLRLTGLIRLVRTLVIVAVFGTMGWRFFADGLPSEFHDFKQTARQFFEDVVAEIDGGAVRQSGQTLNSEEAVNSNPPAEGAWREHLNKAIKLAQDSSQDNRAEAQFRNALFAAEDFTEPDERLTSVLDHFGYFYDQRGRYEEAIPHYLRALNGYRDSVGEAHEYFISLARRLGYAYRAQSAYQSALDYLDVAVVAATNLHGEDYSGVAYGYREVGDIKLTLGDKSGAREAYQLALDTSIRSLGEQHKLTTQLRQAISQLD